MSLIIKFSQNIFKNKSKRKRKKNVLYRKFIKTKDKYWYNRYKYYRDTINSLITKNKRSYLRKNF